MMWNSLIGRAKNWEPRKEMPQFIGQNRKIKLRWAAGVLAGSAFVVMAGATSASAAPDRTPEAVSAVATKDWKYCEAKIVRNGRVYGHLVVRKKGSGDHVKVRPLRGHIKYTKRTRPAVYRFNGKCARSLAALHPRVRHHWHHQWHHQVHVVPSGITF
jgi:hypothetical protein